MHFELPGGQAGDVDISVFELADGVALASAHYPPMVARRSRELLADGRDNYTLGIVSEEHEVSVEGGPGLTVRAGDLVLLNEGTWFEMRHASASAVEVISLPGRGIGRHLARLAAAPGHHIPRGTQGAALLAGYANLLRQAPPQGAGERAAAARHLQELVGVVLEEHAGRARQRHAVPPPGGLRDTRLEMAWQALSSGRGGSIAAIAFECGFSDLSNFNRSFRRRYGLRPSDVRAQALTRRRGQ
nr:MAG: AraC family transcriptional regulator [Pseudomonadota bacterium]